jgi:hypothetical protein
MPKATKPNTTPAAESPPPPFNETWLRALVPSFETDQNWVSRDPMSKAMFAVTGAADRIGGLAEICWALNLSDMQLGGQWAGERGLHHPYGFIAKTLTDVAKGLRSAGKLYSAEMDKEDAAALRASRRAGK